MHAAEIPSFVPMLSLHCMEHQFQLTLINSKGLSIYLL